MQSYHIFDRKKKKKKIKINGSIVTPHYAKTVALKPSNAASTDFFRTAA